MMTDFTVWLCYKHINLQKTTMVPLSFTSDLTLTFTNDTTLTLGL